MRRKKTSKGKRFSLISNIDLDFKKQPEINKSKLHRSFTVNDIRHPLIKKNLQQISSFTFPKKLKKALSSKSFTDKTIEAHIKKYKLKKKTFSEMKELVKNFNPFYHELKILVFHVK